jgi:hypothetical protein
MNNRINFVFVILILLSINFYGQIDTINQTDSQGHKFGYWMEYHENGNIRAEGNYRIIESPLSDEEKFFWGLQVSDSIVRKSLKFGEWKYYDIFGNQTYLEKYENGLIFFYEKYSYDQNGRLIKTEKNGIQTLFGIRKNIEIEQLYYFFTGTIENTFVNCINIKSLSDQTIKIFLTPNSDRLKIRGDFMTIMPNSKLSIPFTYSIPSGSFNDYIEITFINPDTNKIKIEIESYGYHLTSHDLQLSTDEIKEIRFKGNKLYYFREYEECEIKIYEYFPEINLQVLKSEKIKPIIIFPLSLERNEIDLKKLKKGSYLMTSIDYRNNITLMIKLIME